MFKYFNITSPVIDSKFAKVINLDPIDHSYLSELSENRTYYLIEVTEGGHYYPLNYFEQTELDTSYNIIQQIKDNEANVVLFSSDMNVKANLKDMKRQFSLTDEKLIGKPFPFLLIQQFDFEEVFENLSSINIDKKYKVITLCRISKLFREMFLSQVYNLDGVIYTKLNENMTRTLKYDTNDIIYKNETAAETPDALCQWEDYVYLKNNENGYDGSILKQFDETEFRSMIIQQLDGIEDPDYYTYFFPKEYLESYIEIVLETYCTRGVMFSEKVFKPLFMKKPFLVLGTRFYHAFLQDWGFKLYDEIFDYSFDSKNLQSRVNSISDQVKLISLMTMDEVKSMVDSVADKLEYNKRNLYNLKDNNNFYHELLNIDKNAYMPKYMDIPDPVK